MRHHRRHNGAGHLGEHHISRSLCVFALICMVLPARRRRAMDEGEDTNLKYCTLRKTVRVRDARIDKIALNIRTVTYGTSPIVTGCMWCSLDLSRITFIIQCLRSSTYQHITLPRRPVDLPQGCFCKNTSAHAEADRPEPVRSTRLS
jgi:hypothetical protein